MTDHDKDAASHLLIQEIQEDLKREQYARLWKAYGNWAIAAAVAVVLVVAGYQGWRVWRSDLRQDEAERYAAADTRAPEQAVAAMTELAGTAQTDYRLLAELRRAALLAETGKVDEATAAYEALAASDADRMYRDLATLRAIILQFDKGDPAALDARLQGLAGGPWRHTAVEMQALIAQRQGDTTKAVALFKQLADDGTAPQGLRARATEMLAVLKPAANHG